MPFLTNEVMTTASTCGHTVMVHLTRQLGASHIQKAMNLAEDGGYLHVVRLCHNYEQFNRDEVMAWRQKLVMRKSSIYVENWEPTISTWLCYGPKVAVKKTACVCVVIGVSTIWINPWPEQ